MVADNYSTISDCSVDVTFDFAAKSTAKDTTHSYDGTTVHSVSRLDIGGVVSSNSGTITNTSVIATVLTSTSKYASGGNSPAAYCDSFIGGFASENSGTISDRKSTRLNSSHIH